MSGIILLLYLVTFATISAKWAMDLGVSQIRQMLFLFGGMLLGPFMLLILYVYLVNQAQKSGVPAGRLV